MDNSRTSVSHVLVVLSVLNLLSGCASSTFSLRSAPGGVVSTDTQAVPADVALPEAVGGIEELADGEYDVQQVMAEQVVDEAVRKASHQVACTIPQLPTSEQIVNGLPQLPTAGDLWPVTFEEVRCIAVRNAALAKLLDHERGFLLQLASRLCVDKSTIAQVANCLLMYRAERERNAAAALALKAYFHLTEVALQAPLLTESEMAVQQLVDAADGMRDSGLSSDFDFRIPQQRQADVRRQHAELEFNQLRLQHQLKLLLGVLCSPSVIQPHCQIELPMHVDSLAALQSFAVDNRAEMQSQQMLVRSLSATSVPVGRLALSTAEPSLGQSLLQPRGFDLFQPNSGPLEYGFRSQQLQQMRVSTADLIQSEVATAYFEIRKQLRRIAIAQDEVAAATNYQSQVETNHEAGHSQFNDLFESRLTLIKAKSNLVSELIAVKIAEVDLMAAQGVLSQGCQLCTSCYQQNCQCAN